MKFMSWLELSEMERWKSKEGFFEAITLVMYICMWVSSIRLCLNQPCFLYPQWLNLVKSLSTHREENKFKYIYLPNTRARIPLTSD